MSETIGSVLDATRRAQHMPAPILYDDIVDQPTFEAFINGTQFPTPQQIMAFTARLKQNEAPLVFTHTDPISKKSTRQSNHCTFIKSWRLGRR